MQTTTLTLVRTKETKHKVVFAEVPGSPDQPATIDALYLPKQLVGDAPAIEVVLRPVN